MAIPQTIFYLAGYFKSVDDPVIDLKKTLNADGYIPDTTQDMINIIFSNLFPNDTMPVMKALGIFNTGIDLYERSGYRDIRMSLILALKKYVVTTPKKELYLSLDDYPDYALFPDTIEEAK